MTEYQEEGRVVVKEDTGGAIRTSRAFPLNLCIAMICGVAVGAFVTATYISALPAKLRFA